MLLAIVPLRCTLLVGDCIGFCVTGVPWTFVTGCDTPPRTTVPSKCGCSGISFCFAYSGICDLRNSSTSLFLLVIFTRQFLISLAVRCVLMPGVLLNAHIISVQAFLLTACVCPSFSLEKTTGRCFPRLRIKFFSNSVKLILRNDCCAVPPPAFFWRVLRMMFWRQDFSWATVL